MKKIGLIGMCLLLSATTLFAEDKITRNANVLPAKSKEFLNRYFKNVQISHIKIDKGILKTDGYDVILINGMNVEFNGSGEWKEVEGKNIPIPAALVPKKIQQYVQESFPGKMIVAIEKDRRKQEVKLENGIELSFDLSGNLKTID